MSTPNPAAPPSRRKNGTIPSCENCRIAKARCDHTEPCARCLRQKKTCYFHPSPMSQVQGSDSVAPRPAKRRATSSAATESPRAPPPLRKPSAPTPNPLVLLSGASFGYSRLPAKMTLAYMGSTGFGAILEENEPSGLFDKADTGCANPQDQSMKDEGAPWRAFGSSILAWLPSAAAFDGVVDRCFTEGFCGGLEPYTQSEFHRKLRSTYGSLLQQSNRKDGLGLLSDILTANTRSDVPIPPSNQAWLDSFIGTKSRWEMIGIMLVTTGAVAFSTPESDPLHAHLIPEGTSKKSYATSLLEAADACLMLSEEVSPSHLLHVLLLASCTQLQSMVTGDTSHELWMRVGSTAAAVTSLGLHLKANEAESMSTLYHEARIRAFNVAFCTDKSIGTFTGRPPCLSRRYASVNLPLDTSRSAIFHGTDIREIQKTLSPSGWNLEGTLYHATEERASLLLHFLRDEILELALTTIPNANLSDQIDDLRRRMDDTYNDFPVKLRPNIDRRCTQNTPKHELNFIISIQLMHLHNIFLVERIEHPRKDEQRLLSAARDMLAAVVLFWSERDQYPSFRDLIHWFICCYGIPAGSALAIDLWCQSVSPSTNASSPHRASTIQNLSLLVACLEWVGPHDGNYLLCRRVAKMIQNILERALAPSFQTTPVFSGYDLTDISLADMPAFGHELENWFDSNGWGGAMQY